MGICYIPFSAFKQLNSSLQIGIRSLINETTCGFYFRQIIQFCNHFRHRVAQEAVDGRTMWDTIVTPSTGTLPASASRCLPAECPFETEMNCCPSLVLWIPNNYSCCRQSLILTGQLPGQVELCWENEGQLTALRSWTNVRQKELARLSTEHTLH